MKLSKYKYGMSIDPNPNVLHVEIHTCDSGLICELDLYCESHKTCFRMSNIDELAFFLILKSKVRRLNGDVYIDE